MYIYTNTCVLRERAVPDLVCWYDANILFENSDTDALGLVSISERNRKFDAMQAQDKEEDDMKANQAPREYPPNQIFGGRVPIILRRRELTMEITTV